MCASAFVFGEFILLSVQPVAVATPVVKLTYSRSRVSVLRIAGQAINPTRVKYFLQKNYSANFSETRGIDWNLLGASNDIRGTRGSYGNIPN